MLRYNTNSHANIVRMLNRNEEMELELEFFIPLPPRNLEEISMANTQVQYKLTCKHHQDAKSERGDGVKRRTMVLVRKPQRTVMSSLKTEK